MAPGAEAEPAFPPGGTAADLPPPTLLPLAGDPADHHPLSSAKKVFFNIVISIVGAGVLGLPYTFRRSGWLVGSAAVIGCAVLCYHCMMLLVRCRRRLERDGTHGIATYGDLGRHAYGEAGHRAVDFLVLISQGGCCVAYLIFIGENLSSLFPATPSHFLGKTAFILLLTPIQVLLAWVRSLSGLAPFSIVADAANLLAMAVVVKDDVGDFRSFERARVATGWEHVFFALGVSVYCFEGFSLTLPLESSLKTRARFGPVLGLAFAAITALYVAFGLAGYLAYGEATAEIVTLNLPAGWSSVAVKLALCVGLFFTFPVMMQPVHEIFERRAAAAPCFARHVAGRGPAARAAVFRLVRLLVVLAAALLAVRVPGFAQFIDLVGSTVCAMLAFVLPALLHLHIYGADVSQLELGVDWMLVVFGIVFAVYGTYDSVRSFWRGSATLTVTPQGTASAGSCLGLTCHSLGGLSTF